MIINKHANAYDHIKAARQIKKFHHYYNNNNFKIHHLTKLEIQVQFIFLQRLILIYFFHLFKADFILNLKNKDRNFDFLNNKF